MWMAIEALGAGDRPTYNVESGPHGRGLRHMDTQGEIRGEGDTEGGRWLARTVDALGVKDREDLKSCLFPQKLSPFLPTEPPNLLTPT